MCNFVFMNDGLTKKSVISSGESFGVVADKSAVKQHNDEMNLAWKYLSATGTSVFLTGKAGTGKTTFLRRFRQLSLKRMIVLAPTGVAAINAGGQTIHSFFQLAPGMYFPGKVSDSGNKFYRMAEQKKKLIRSLDLLVIDEVSMVRADLLDAVDEVLRRYKDGSKPFGGVQLLLIGDLMQLAPVARPDEWTLLKEYYETPYFFSSRALRQIAYVTIELKHIYRQQDEAFINLLAKVRDGNMDAAAMELLNSRCISEDVSGHEDWIRITTHNHSAQQYNDFRMSMLPSKLYSFRAIVKDDFPQTVYPAEDVLQLKKGAHVMFIKNDSTAEHVYYNGKLGIVSDISDEWVEVTCKEDDKPIRVSRVTWDNIKYTIDDESKEITQQTVGTFSQIPLRLAWAITVHKSQGLTFDNVVLDIDASFTHGQVYVALSRCRTLAGTLLATPVHGKSVITDSKVRDYISTSSSLAEQSKAQLPFLMRQYTMQLLSELYSFRDISRSCQWMIRVLQEHTSGRDNLINLLMEADRQFEIQVALYGYKFINQCTAFLGQGNNIVAGTPLAERIQKSCAYFSGTLCKIFSNTLFSQLKINLKNKKTARIYDNARTALQIAVHEKCRIFDLLADKQFSVTAYLDSKAKARLSESATKTTTHKSAAPKKLKQQNKPKTDTFAETLRLYRSGLSIEDIARKRGLALSTIVNHLSRLVAECKIASDELLSPEKRNRIFDVIRAFDGNYSLTAVKEKLPADYSYADIRIAIASATLPGD